MQSNPSIVFMGTPEFAVPSMQALHSRWGLSAVVTAPDKVRGRGTKTSPTEVAEAAPQGVPVLKPESLRSADFAEQIAALKPDIICVVAFRILPKEVYSLARLGAFNIHGSLLPRYRGAAPIQWAVLNGDAETGLTTFLLDAAVDTGNTLLQARVSLSPDDTFGDLYHALMPLSAQIAVDTVEMLLDGTAVPTPQNPELATAAPKIFRDHARLNFNTTAVALRRAIHGYSPVPGAWTLLDGEQLKLYRTAAPVPSTLQAGQWAITEGRLLVGAADGMALPVLQLQLQGKRAMSAADFINGWRGAQQGSLV